MDPYTKHTGTNRFTQPVDTRGSKPALNIGTVVAFVILVPLFVLAATAGGILLGDAKAVTLQPAPSLAGVISQSLGTNADGSLPVVGNDYRLSTKYFDNNTWAVAYITPVGKNFEPSAAVLKKIEGTFQVVIEPSNALPVSTVKALPTDVTNYLRTYVAIYQPLPSQQ